MRFYDLSKEERNQLVDNINNAITNDLVSGKIEIYIGILFNFGFYNG